MIDSTALFVCDMQERFRAAILHFDTICKGCSRLIEGCKLLNIPMIVTEQYPQGLLHTVKELDITHANSIVSKTKFTMITDEVTNQMAKLCNGSPPKSVIICGVEAHVCVQQTVLDLLKQNITVYVAADAVSSRRQEDRLMALSRLASAGAIITTVESILFQLVADKNHPQFKSIQSLIKELLPETGLKF